MEHRTEAVWRAVAEMEQNFYTKKEIAETLRGVADEIDVRDVVEDSQSESSSRNESDGSTRKDEIYGER